MFQQWHWWQWNFDPVRHADQESPFAIAVLDALLRCDGVMPGFATEMLDRVASFGGRDGDLSDYEQCRQWLGELLVVHHLATWPWPAAVAFEHEPTLEAGVASPEIVMWFDDFAIGVEVKTPDLRSHSRLRNTNPWQLNTRLELDLVEGLKAEGVTWPRDNPLKDFCESASWKFTGWGEGEDDFYGILFVVWDDFINEPISALTSRSAGLFTESSYHRAGSGERVAYPNLDTVVLLRHQHQFQEGMANRPPVDMRYHCLDYGSLDRFPPHARIDCPDGGQKLPEAVGAALQAAPPSPMMGAEYAGGEMVMWVDGDADDD